MGYINYIDEYLSGYKITLHKNEYITVLDNVRVIPITKLNKLQNKMIGTEITFKVDKSFFGNKIFY